MSTPAAESVDMFDAMKAHDIDVKLIPKDERESRVIIKNNTGKPLSVRLPDAFAGVPVLAQQLGAGVRGAGARGGGAAAAGIPYEIKPIESVTTKPEVRELLSAFGKGRLNQRATQAAAWHLANGLTWQQLASKRIQHLDGSSEIWFSPQEIQAAIQISENAVSQAEQKSKNSLGPDGSLNQSVSKTE
ncbi:MAG: hypothetical protein HY288_06425 [Planctomycetia bacterium]|nr:hypothetical protein [Planctomycetia bacterium]